MLLALTNPSHAEMLILGKNVSIYGIFSLQSLSKVENTNYLMLKMCRPNMMGRAVLCSSLLQVQYSGAVLYFGKNL